MDFTLGLYRFSGWSQDIVWLLICWMMLRRKWYWKQYKAFFLAYAISVTIFELIYAITALTLTNNLFLDYIYIPLELMLLGFFLKGIIKLKWIDYFVYAASVIYALFAIFNAFWGEGYENYNSYGALISSLYLTFLSGLSLFILFKRNVNKRLFSMPESWLVFGIFLIYTSIIIFDYIYGLAVPYKNDTILYAVLITQNFLKSFFLFFYIKGISLIKKM
ncbi:hypothetical protein [Emticicia agri]|uniref:Uncharacterized protein n=1 Tax=Emticicia agri TaxID=2492393 RepID=A0A4Q5LW53_9BACT|nr:hypothetical protein [Emticicia agri]RYU93789.1 hypothetical protein EWM59_20500 [Emticicia agri]